jgi:hypothetical protein
VLKIIVDIQTMLIFAAGARLLRELAVSGEHPGAEFNSLTEPIIKMVSCWKFKHKKTAQQNCHAAALHYANVISFTLSASKRLITSTINFTAFS